MIILMFKVVRSKPVPFFGQVLLVGFLLVGLPSNGRAQFGPSLPFNAAVLGHGAFTTPGYWALPASVNPPPSLVAMPVPSYLSAAPYVPGIGWPWGYPVSPWSYGNALRGQAALTAATGQYWRDITEARLQRERYLQANLETARQRVEFQRWYESTRPTAATLMAQQRAADLHWARYDAQNTQIWSGRPLNVLLQSILLAPDPGAGPVISLDQETVWGLNLTDGTTRASLALAKDKGRITWTEALQAKAFDDTRESFSTNFAKAIGLARKGEVPPVPLVRSLREELADLNAKLDGQVQELPPSRFIEARRLLNQLNRTIQGLSDARLIKASNDSWRRTIHTVADLVLHCKRNGLEFGPAVAPGDFPAYIAAYYAIRDYERSIWRQAGR